MKKEYWVRLELETTVGGRLPEDASDLAGSIVTLLRDRTGQKIYVDLTDKRDPWFASDVSVYDSLDDILADVGDGVLK